MTYAAKYRISQTATAIGGACSVLSLVNLAGAGRTGNIHQVKFWFGTLIVCVALTLPFVIAYYYYRDRRFDIKDQQQIAVETLAKLGEQRKGKL